MGFTQREYWDLKCWTEFEFWIYEGREFQTYERENTNIFRYTFVFLNEVLENTTGNFDDEL